MESIEHARERITARRRELLTELADTDRALARLDTTVIVSIWWTAPSGPGKRGTAYHRDAPANPYRKCLPRNPQRISLYEAGLAGLNPCRACHS
ncbi:hypothetical protein ABZZ20_35825 [Streptomyces sp. NPDC006430]|uniref:hypothetical protein n=1 Tax=Streptomyces sp. NPDC006430 TaxID=3154299 RepID=UPI0033BE8102